MHRINELRDVGEEGWGVLRTRLDRLAGDLEKALGGFVSALSDAVKRQSSGSEPPPSSETSTAEKTATPPAEGATKVDPPAADSPGTGDTPASGQ